MDKYEITNHSDSVIETIEAVDYMLEDGYFVFSDGTGTKVLTIERKFVKAIRVVKS